MSRHLKGGLGNLRIKKHSYSATIRLQVMAKLLETDEFAGERLGLHFLRGHWAPVQVPHSSHSKYAAVERVWEGSVAREGEQLEVNVTHGCPELVGVIERIAKARRAGGVGDEDEGEEEGGEGEEVTAAEKAALAATEGYFRCSDESDESDALSMDGLDGELSDDSEGQLEASAILSHPFHPAPLPSYAMHAQSYLTPFCPYPTCGIFLLSWMRACFAALTRLTAK